MEYKTVSVDLMRRSDAFTIAHLVESEVLMYKAGEAVYNSVNWHGRVAVVCGSGNNAGDGYVIAQLLCKAGIYCKLYILKDKFSEDGRFYFDQCVDLGIDYVIIENQEDFIFPCDEPELMIMESGQVDIPEESLMNLITDYDFIVDCMYGTGFKGAVHGDAAEVIKAINQSDAYVVSVDINSGMNGDSGESVLCVESDLTVSIGFVKQGLVTEAGRRHMKELVNVDIGIVLLKE